jgi:hypothetical protein
MQIGFKFQEVWTCSYYSSDMIDDPFYFFGAFRTVRAFAVTANAFVGIAMICLIVSAYLDLATTMCPRRCPKRAALDSRQRP